MPWRWDQGRLQYFQFDTIRDIAKILVAHEGVSLRVSQDPLRTPLTTATALPFAPASYTVWRNYSRVFGCQLLATQIDERLVCTQLCLELTKNPSRIDTVDDYLAHLTKRFYYPSPVFEGYNLAREQVFPFCAILKLLISKTTAGNSNYITIDEIFEKIIANGFTGKEPLSRYTLAKASTSTNSLDEKRQVRELVRFMSQFSFLKWDNPKLYLDIASPTQDYSKELIDLATPIITPRDPDRSKELVALGNVIGAGFVFPEMKDRIYSEDNEFIEGRKIRVTHLRTERSRKLRDLFFSSLKPPYLCDMCTLKMAHRYPWTTNLLDVHHVLPLSSPVRFEAGRTSIKDLVGLCPNCHRATHNFYKGWLSTKSQDDFQDYGEARQVYDLAKSNVILK